MQQTSPENTFYGISYLLGIIDHLQITIKTELNLINNMVVNKDGFIVKKLKEITKNRDELQIITKGLNYYRTAFEKIEEMNNPIGLAISQGYEAAFSTLPNLNNPLIKKKSFILSDMHPMFIAGFQGLTSGILSILEKTQDNIANNTELVNHIVTPIAKQVDQQALIAAKQSVSTGDDFAENPVDVSEALQRRLSVYIGPTYDKLKNKVVNKATKVIIDNNVQKIYLGIDALARCFGETIANITKRLLSEKSTANVSMSIQSVIGAAYVYNEFKNFVNTYADAKKFVSGTIFFPIISGIITGIVETYQDINQPLFEKNFFQSIMTDADLSCNEAIKFYKKADKIKTDSAAALKVNIKLNNRLLILRGAFLQLTEKFSKNKYASFFLEGIKNLMPAQMALSNFISKEVFKATKTIFKIPGYCIAKAIGFCSTTKCEAEQKNKVLVIKNGLAPRTQEPEQKTPNASKKQ